MRNLSLLLFFIILLAPTLFGQDRDKRTAFAKMVFVNNHPYVFYQGKQVKLLGLAGYPVDTYLRLAREEDPTDWRARGPVLRRLPNSGIAVSLSRIVSYQPDGNLYDGHGVVPDIKHSPTLQDKLGQTDSILESAIKMMKEL